ncbi:M24 family metallopeptidase [Mesoplasma lactucae]|uniref:Xaa-Pro dipeptidase n=1 Tax=Mesoplasma lactucae ATCC 49193 TaxID=81460 RepID=A0A291IS09_9MOLU|nr:Xaa-Pro peptidase family protein [Mesoplasma lactucae]ATG97471.1 Xaa-Pro dipeptidase [Mesoplasma lactucae ATCC 49193]ATZ20074.1 Xaa-Pro dipeptidase [Mesoplasma lactucae ATCC 49193]MCL8216822.1 Aminopeptidase YpdF [Mesoplasma lactucae ATCC 49193]
MNKKEIINNLLKENNLDAMMLYSEQNRYWYSQFHSSLGYIFITKNKSYLLLDGRYITAARESKELENIDEIIWFKGDLNKLITDILKQDEVKKIGFESDWVLYRDYQGYKQALKDFEWLPVNTDKIRMIKDEREISYIKKACDITNEVFMDVLRFVQPKMTEQEISIFVSDSFLKHGADKLSFDTIVASGENGSKPHAVPTNRVIKKGDFVTLDMGCYYKGYASDQTRTFLVGEKGTEEMQKIYDTVYQAQSLGISLLKPGAICSDIHNTVAKFIADAGYEGYFNHGLGHGLGIEIHEEPYENPSCRELLKEGMTITVEPGIYIPSVGGVRIEDDFVITKTGSERLTSSPRELMRTKA